MRRSSFALTLPLVAFGLPADAEPVLLAKLEPKIVEAVAREAPPTEARVRMYVATVVPSDAGPVVLLRDADRAQIMPIWIGTAEARAIQRAIDGARVPRPMTHDLMASLVERLGAEVVDVEVSALVDGTFIGTAHLRGAQGVLAIDARPSDLLALALRVDAPIFVDADVLDAARLDPPYRVAPSVKL